jgi:AraC-like DNA-binding protein
MPITLDIYKKIIDAKLFIDEHFDLPIDLDAIAGEACLSRYHFHRLFRRIYKRTPHQYLTFKRIDRAQRILAAADCTVGEVCMQVGFESIGSFSLLFKKEIGVAPGEYREASKLSRAKAEEQPRRVIPFCFIAEITGEKSNNREAGLAAKK